MLADTIPGVRVVKAFAQEQREIERFRVADKHIFDTNDRVNKTWSFFTPMIKLLTDIGLLIVWAVGAWSVAHDSITVGVLTGFVLYISSFYERMDSMSRFTASRTLLSGSMNQKLFPFRLRIDRIVLMGDSFRGLCIGNIGLDA